MDMTCKIPAYKKVIRKLFGHVEEKIDIKPVDAFPVEASDSERKIRDLVMPCTMTSQQRIWSLLSAVKYIERANIQGDFVECGVWRGGSAMAMACQLIQLGNTERHIWLYDTFQGMTEPTSVDIEAYSGRDASSLLTGAPKVPANNIWCIATRQDVEQNLALTGYPKQKVNFVEGDVLKTLDQFVPEKISLLRLDTDWYESTKKELEVLFPQLVPGGVCIIDDYGYWNGSRKAVDEYLSSNGLAVLMHCIDDTGRVFIKN